MIDIGVKISTLRQGLGLSQDAFAAKLGYSKAKVQNIEAGKQRVDHEFLTALATIFAVDMNDLLGFTPLGGSRDVNITTPEFIPIPRYSVQASAGQGALVDGEETTGFYAFNQKWLARRGLNAANLAVIAVRGDSMEPRLTSGDLILIDRAQRQIADGVAYVVRLGDDLVVKHIQRTSARTISLISANQLYPIQHVELAALGELAGQIEVIGRVMASMHEW